jgi:glycosyltransferase involved in cell wall biosynthesis
MRLLIVSQYFWPEEFRINDLAGALVARGHHVCVLTGYPTYPRRGAFTENRPAIDDWHDVRIVRVPLAARDSGERWRLAANYLSYATSATLLGPWRLGLVGHDRPEVILNFQISPLTALVPALALGRRYRAPVVAWVQDLWPESLAAVGAVRSPRALNVLAPAAAALYQRCDQVLAHSAEFHPALLARGVAADRLGYLPAWAEGEYRPLPADPALAAALALPAGFVAMVAGNLGIAQSLETVVDAASRLRDNPAVHWVIVGDGQRRAWLADEVVRRGLTGRVHLVGRQPVERMPGLFAHADVLVATLRRDGALAMTLPARVQSYLACGRPVVGALDGEGARVIQEAGGFAVPAGDGAGLAAAVARVAAMDADERRAAGEAARAYYLRHFERSMLIDRFEAVLGDAAAGLPLAATEAVLPAQRVPSDAVPAATPGS